MRHGLARIALVVVAMVASTSALAASALGAQAGGSGGSASSSAKFAALPGSVSPTSNPSTGTYSTPAMSIQVVLAPSHQAQLQSVLKSTYDPKSADYQRWLSKGQFDSSFAPSSSETSAVTGYLTASGLTVGPSASPFLISATGSSSQVSGAFKTALHNYTDPKGHRYFANASAAQLPASLTSRVLGVVGLSNTVRTHSMVQRAPSTVHPAAAAPAAASSSANVNCEAPYPTRASEYAYYVDGIDTPFGYGGGPGCSGLTPSQDNSIYDAPTGGARVKGGGENLAVFELSAYKKADIQTWADQFYGKSYTPPLVNVVTDGGPLAAKCPKGDTCPPKYNYYSGDIEVDADIEMQLAVAPDAKQVTVYEAPNDYTGQTELDDYSKIADQDAADVVSSSWGVCENDISAGYAQAENEIFEQLALQGQSVFSAAGDTGAFDCIRSDGTNVVNVDDPPSQPWVTSVGGTSLEAFNPGTETNPAYPQYTETVWNPDNLCNQSANEGGEPGLFWCDASGAGGGGISQYWGRPYYQSGPGVNNTYTQTGNGSTRCSLAAKGTPCREVPDISVNADENTPYSEYCTGSASTPYSYCGQFSASTTPPGWFGIGGTSLSSPFMSAIIADRDGYQGHRVGNANPLLYGLFDEDASTYFHDLTAFGQTTTNNGLYPMTTGFDLATGIGSPIMAPLITGQG